MILLHLSDAEPTATAVATKKTAPPPAQTKAAAPPPSQTAATAQNKTQPPAQTKTAPAAALTKTAQTPTKTAAPPTKTAAPPVNQTKGAAPAAGQTKAGAAAAVLTTPSAPAGAQTKAGAPAGAQTKAGVPAAPQTKAAAPPPVTPTPKLNVVTTDTAFAKPLIIMREAFTYDRAGRRDPFLSLLTTTQLRPTLSDLKLMGTVVDEPGRSVALLLDNNAKKQLSVRVGMQLGRMRVASIRSNVVVFTIEEFGTNRRDSLLLRDSTKMRGR